VWKTKTAEAWQLLRQEGLDDATVGTEPWTNHPLKRTELKGISGTPRQKAVLNVCFASWCLKHKVSPSSPESLVVVKDLVCDVSSGVERKPWKAHIGAICGSTQWYLFSEAAACAVDALASRCV